MASTTPIASMGVDSTIVSQMTVMSSQHATELLQLKQQNKLLHLQLLQLSTYPTTESKWKKEKRKQWRSDESVGVEKTKKYYNKTNTTCYTYRYDVEKGYTSVTCKHKSKGHIDTHTGDNPTPEHNSKDIKFSQ